MEVLIWDDNHSIKIRILILTSLKTGGSNQIDFLQAISMRKHTPGRGCNGSKQLKAYEMWSTGTTLKSLPSGWSPLVLSLCGMQTTSAKIKGPCHIYCMQFFKFYEVLFVYRIVVCNICNRIHYMAQVVCLFVYNLLYINIYSL